MMQRILQCVLVHAESKHNMNLNKKDSSLSAGREHRIKTEVSFRTYKSKLALTQ